MNHRFQRLSTPTMFPSFFASFNSFKSYPFAHILGNSFAVLALTEKRRSDEGKNRRSILSSARPSVANNVNIINALSSTAWSLINEQRAVTGPIVSDQSVTAN